MVKRFQSLFFWNHYLDLTLCIRCYYLTDVSILVFLEPLLRPRIILWKVGGSRVSILVFLEPLLRRRKSVAYPDVAVVSILVFLEPLLRHKRQGLIYSDRGSFNPCFSGTTT